MYGIWHIRPFMDDKLWWKRIFDVINLVFDGRRLSMEDEFWLKINFDERWPLMADTLWWLTTFCGRRPSMEEDFCWKTTFERRQLLMEDGRPSRKDSLWSKMTDHTTVTKNLNLNYSILFYSFIDSLNHRRGGVFESREAD